MKRFISLGAGVQSTTMLLMSLNGDLERADCAIFADTQDEPKAVYDHLECGSKAIAPSVIAHSMS